MDSKILLIFLFGILITTVAGVKVGVVVEFPDESLHMECVSVPENSNGYEVMEATSLGLEWSYYDLWGHSLCKIEDTGCPSSNCWCSSSYWGFFIKDQGSWGYSPVGFDGGSACWNGDLFSYDGHYCAENGDLMGFIYAEYGAQPPEYEFSDVCLPGDIDLNGMVDYSDLLALTVAYGTSSGEDSYNAAADFNSDGTVGYEDLLILAVNYSPQ